MLKEKLVKVYKNGGPTALLFAPFDFIIDKSLSILIGDKKRLALNSIDVYLRHKYVSEALPNTLNSVLEVGGANSYLELFFKKKIIKLDKDLTNADICANGCKLPFKSSSFESAVAIATLEHLPKEKRNYFIKELKRVAKKLVILYTPIENGDYDKKLYDLKSKIGIKDRWTQEHILYGLPTEKELKKEFPGCKVKKVQNCDVWLITTFASSIPLLGRFLPRLIYNFLKDRDNQPPFIGCVIKWEKK